MTIANLARADVICPLDSLELSLDVAGGKGANLGAMLRAGLPVPGGFVVTTAAYRAFVTAAGLAPLIEAQWQAIDPARAASFETAATQLRTAFAAAPLPQELAGPILAA